MDFSSLNFSKHLLSSAKLLAFTVAFANEVHRLHEPLNQEIPNFPTK